MLDTQTMAGAAPTPAHLRFVSAETPMRGLNLRLILHIVLHLSQGICCSQFWSHTCMLPVLVHLQMDCKGFIALPRMNAVGVLQALERLRDAS
jgi:hypothetical protein